jgi:putative transposase
VTLVNILTHSCILRRRAAGNVPQEIQISMDSRGRCLDNVFIERLWRSLKYELIYLKAFEDGIHLKQEVSKWFNWYNDERPHQALQYRTPHDVYQESCLLLKAA